MPDKIKNAASKTGEIPRDEIEPLLRRNTPRPQRIPERFLNAEEQVSKTGVMPLVTEEPDDDVTRDEDSPAGR